MKQTDENILFQCSNCGNEIIVKKKNITKKAITEICNKCNSHHFICNKENPLIAYIYSTYVSIKLKSNCSICGGGQSGICYGKEAHGSETEQV